MAQISFNNPSYGVLVASKSANWNTGYSYVTGNSATIATLQSVSGSSTYTQSRSAFWDTAYTFATNTSANVLVLQSGSAYWDTTHSWVTSFSANPTLETLHITNSAYVQNKLGVGIQQPIHPLHVVGNTLIEGNLTASGTITYKNTDFTTFTALSVDNGGTTTALLVKQRGDFGVAEFKDGDDTAMFIDGHSDRPGFIGVKTRTPNVEFTVVGRVSATDFIYSPNIFALQEISGTNAIVQSNSAFWDTAYTFATNTSANVLALQEVSGGLGIIQTNSAFWDTAYTHAVNTSATTLALQAISGSNAIVQTNSGYWTKAYTHAVNTSAATLALQEVSGANAIVQTNSAFWDTAYTFATNTSANVLILQEVSGGLGIVQTNSASWDTAYTFATNISANVLILQEVSGANAIVQSNSAFWDTAYTFATNTSANVLILQGISGTNTIVQSNSAFWDTAYTFATNTSANVLALQTNSASWDTAYTFATNTSANVLILQGVSAAAGLVQTSSAYWDTTHSWVTSFSANPTLATLHITNSAYVQNKLGVGIQTPLHPLHVVGNTLIEGNLTATGIITYTNTNTTTFTALSVDNGGSVTALLVKQRGNFGIAEFKDGDDTAMFIDGHSDRPGFVGVKTITPNVELTVVGKISATDFIYSPNVLALQELSGSGLLVQSNSAKWESAYTVTNATSANVLTLQGVSAGSGLVQSNSAKWDTAYTFATNTSANVTALQGASGVWSESIINYIIDGGISPIVTGKKGTVVLPSAFQITEWTLCSNTPSSITVDVLSATAGSYPTSNSITLGTPPALQAGQSVRRASVAWGKLQAGDIIEFNVTVAAAAATIVTLSLKGKKS